ncbi:DUF402 domain-containing protein [Fictibacillus sp. 7GRE50]|nr:DUF402 domain-containing protein [Fictibacillus sp. 7GRE50]
MRLLKRKYGDYRDWKRVTQKRFAQTLISSTDFEGYATLIDIVQVTDPLFKKYGESDVCIVDNGYKWLQHFPLNEKHSLTTMFNSKGEVIQWYIDICKENGVEKNVPWMDDLFIDIVVLPSGKVFHLDTDELEEAYQQGSINKHLYDIAWNEANQVTKLIDNGDFKLFDLANNHKHILEQKLN